MTAEEATKLVLSIMTLAIWQEQNSNFRLKRDMPILHKWLNKMAQRAGFKSYEALKKEMD